MINGKKILAIIPARGNSKGIPGKNTRAVAQKPLIFWTIDEALKSSYIDRIDLNTDSENIINTCKGKKIGIPFKRPDILATDTAKMADVITDHLEYYKNKNINFDFLLLLQPTSPLRTRNDIDGIIEFTFKHGYKSAISVCEADHPPYLFNTLERDSSMANFYKPKELNKNRQESHTYYRINGALYFISVPYFFDCRSFLTPQSYGYIMTREKSIDIDTPYDLKIAGFLLKDMKNTQ